MKLLYLPASEVFFDIQVEADESEDNSVWFRILVSMLSRKQLGSPKLERSSEPVLTAAA